VIFHCFYHEVFTCMEYGCMMNWWWWMHILVTIGVQEKHVPIIKLMMYYCVRKLGACIVSLQHSFHVLRTFIHIVDPMFVLFFGLVPYGRSNVKNLLILTCHILGHGCNMWWFTSRGYSKSFQWISYVHAKFESFLISICHILGHGCNMWWFMSKDYFRSFQWTFCLHIFWTLFQQLDYTYRRKWCWTHDWNFNNFISTSLLQQLFLACMNQLINNILLIYKLK
jgi:hypothetical protein